MTPTRAITKPEVYAVYHFFMAEARERWPKAIFPKLFPADRRWLRDVLDLTGGDLEEVAELIRVLIWDWEEVCRRRERFFAKGGLHPTVRDLARSARELLPAIGRGVSEPRCTLGSYYDRYVSSLNSKPTATPAEFFAARQGAVPTTEEADVAAARVAASEARWPSLAAMQGLYETYKRETRVLPHDNRLGKTFDLEDRRHVYALLYRYGSTCAANLTRIAARDFDRIRARRKEGRFWLLGRGGPLVLDKIRFIAPSLVQYVARGGVTDDSDFPPELLRAINDGAVPDETVFDLIRDRFRRRAEALPKAEE